MKKRWTAALLAFVLAVSLLPAPVRAAQAADAGGAGSRLTGVERAVYDCMKAEIAKVAKGTRTSTEIKIPDQSALSWPLSELGTTGSEVSSAVDKKLAEALDMRKVFDCLSLDCPYEMFWRDDRFTWGHSVSRAGNRVSVKNLIICVEVAQSYRGGSATATNPSKIAEANKAAANAQAIVDQYQDLPDFEKLAAYREEICRLASYNTAAARGNMPYGDPWQMIYVFDGDPSTNVVCEGYAKAFQYLCDLSEFSGDVVCRTVSGTMNAGNHMWNVVQMEDGRNYLVDVTNCDSGSIGADDKLFLAGAAASEDGRTYTVSVGGLKSVYTYDEEQEGLYTDGYLCLSGTDYAPGTDLPAEPAPSPTAQSSSFADVDPEAYYAEAVAWAVENNITKGTAETAFSPAQTCTHGQILTFLWRAAGEPDSSGEAPQGVTAEDYCFDAVRWAAELGMLEEDFSPEADCSRMDAVWYIWRAFGGPGYMVATGFTDVPDPVDSLYAWAVGWALLEGITTGTSDTTFEPDAICDRGQIVTFLYRAYLR